MKKILCTFLLICMSLFCEITDINGKDVKVWLSDKKYELLILNYWAIYCTPCKEEMKDLSKIYNEYKNQGLLVAGISVDESNKGSLVKKICTALNVNYPVAYGASNIFEGKEIVGLPRTYIIDKSGKVIDYFDGKRDYAYFKEIIEKHLWKNKQYNYFELSYKVSKKSSKKYLIDILIKPSKNMILSKKDSLPLTISFKDSKSIKFSNKDFIFKEQNKTGFKISTTVEFKEKIEDVIYNLNGVACTSTTCYSLKNQIVIPKNEFDNK